MPFRTGVAAPLWLAVALIFAAPASANFDLLPGEPFDAESDVPYASAAPVTKTSPIFDTSAFGEDSGELNSPTVFLGCGRWGARTAWVRFATRVSGSVNVSVDSSILGPGGHDVFFKLYTARSANSDYSQLNADESLANTPCSASRVALPDEQGGPYPVSIPAGQSRVLYVQVLSVCAERPDLPPCTAPERSSAPGGNTNVTLTYIPDDSDRDGTADSLDPCPQPTDPCNRDSDGDGITDDVDACPVQPNPCAVDADGDGFSKNALPNQREDCDDADRDVNPGEDEVRGNRKDDNCDEIALPFPRVTNKITAEYGGRRGRADNFDKLLVRNVRRGLRVVVECRGRGCPGPREYRPRKARRRLDVRGKLGRVRLAPGARVTVKLLRKRHVGRVVIYSFRKRGAPRQSERCTLPGRRKVLRLARCAPRGADAAGSRR